MSYLAGMILVFLATRRGANPFQNRRGKFASIHYPQSAQVDGHVLSELISTDIERPVENARMSMFSSSLIRYAMR